MKAIQTTRHSGRRVALASAFAVGAMASLSSTGVLAVEVLRFDYQGAAAVCQPSAPIHETNLRSRPLGLSNSGTKTAFVTCANQGSDPTGQRGAYQVLVNVGNNDTVAKRITCTLVVVFRKPGETANRTVYSPRAADVPAGSGGFIAWVPTDLTGQTGGPEIPKWAVSCGLPKKTTLQYTGSFYKEEVGN
jgi:hypothetical protein